MYEVIPCNGDCFNCPYPDCIVSKLFRTPFEQEQIELVKRKKAEAEKKAKEEAARQRKIDSQYSKWLKKNGIR